MEYYKNKKIALFHPWIKSKGGAERVVLEILKDNKKNIDCYTWVYDKENTFEEFKEYSIKVIAPKISKKFSRSYISRGFFLLFGLFSKIPLKKYDIFFISTSGMGELITIRNYKPKKTFAYVHTILRATHKDEIKWNLKNRYKNFFSRMIYFLAIKIYRLLEKMAWKKIDCAIFNSELSLKRAKEHNLLENKMVKIVYPPIDITKFNKLKTRQGDYFLYVSRLNNSKRQDLFLKAWAKFIKENPKEKLIIAGNIENKKYFEKIKKLAKQTKNVEIKVNSNEKEILRLYENCKAVIFIPYLEDFGIVPFEALATGVPLIATNKGGFVKLIEEVPQYYKIKEKESEEEIIREINKTLNNFLNTNIIPKRIILREITLENFLKNINEIVKNPSKLG